MEIGLTSEVFELLEIISERQRDLRQEKLRLQCAEQDLQYKIKYGRGENSTTTNEAKIWLDEAWEVLSEVEKFQYDCRRGDGCHSDRLMPDQPGCHYDRLLEDLRRLTAERDDLTVFVPSPPDPVVPWPESSPAIGVENILSEICGFVEDEGSRIMGLYGMGGVGKTTLLIAIYNLFFGKRSGRFDLVIRVVVSRHFDIDLVQKQIFSRLGYSDGKLPPHGEERTTMLRKKLVQMKFLLLLDDLWEKLDLEEVGIPLSEKGSKMVFTTRSKEVCTVMKASHQVKVSCLTPESSWKLFRQRVGENIDKLDPFTSSLARKVAEKCGGLPLALVTVGEAMAKALTEREWEAALKTLKGAGAEVIGMDKVRTSLKFSYYRLKDPCHQECLLYCSLFPEDCVIQVDELIDYWVGEALLETLGDQRQMYYTALKDARVRGQMAIEALKAACLLEDGRETKISKECNPDDMVGETAEFVKVHGMVREMALWITNRRQQYYKTVFAVDPSEIPESRKMSQNWTRAERISLMSNRISNLPNWPWWPSLTTLLLSGCSNLTHLPNGFFRVMSLITVLDLSRTKIRSLPAEIELAVQLRYLNLKGTLLESLPKEVGRVERLRILNLDQLFQLKKIPKEAISSLEDLQSLNMNVGSYEWRGGWKDNVGEYEERQVCLKDLDGLENLEELQLKIGVKFHEDLRGLSICRRLCSVIRFLEMTNLESFSTSSFFNVLGASKELRKLSITNCRKTSFTLDLRDQQIFRNLQDLKIVQCNATEKIWITKLRCLRSLQVEECPKMVEIILVEESKMSNEDPEKDSFLPSLMEISLITMQNLKSICRRPLLLPSLKKVCVRNCPELENLSFELKSATRLQDLQLIGCKNMAEMIGVGDRDEA